MVRVPEELQSQIPDGEPIVCEKCGYDEREREEQGRITKNPAFDEYIWECPNPQCGGPNGFGIMISKMDAFPDDIGGGKSEHQKVQDELSFTDY